MADLAMGADRPATSSARRLTPETITAVTGEENLENLEELEIIFNPVSEIGGLENCAMLRSLTLIDCGLRRISNLEPVSRTLMQLCLCDQGLRKMERLCLPNLRELFLHQNKITKIEGLHGCPSLQRLWLFSNRITTMENLHHCGALRELWLQENAIQKVAGLDSLVHLQSLNLAGNPITAFKDVQNLFGGSLPCLVEVSLNDVHFGACPVTTLDGYRNFIVCYLRQMRRLDGVEVVEQDRVDAQGKYAREALRFQDRLDEMEQARAREIAQTELLGRRSVDHGKQLKAEMMEALSRLESVVQEGRAAMEKERNRQMQVHQANVEVLEASLAELQRAYAKEVDRRIAAEQAKMEQEEKIYEVLERRTVVDEEYGKLLLRIQGSVALQELGQHSADFQHLQKHVWARQKMHAGRSKGLVILKACRLYNGGLVDSYLSAGGETHTGDCLYLGVSLAQAARVCCEGLSGLNENQTGQQARQGSPVVLFTDPAQAFWMAPPVETVPDRPQAEADAELGQVGLVIQFRVAVDRAGTVPSVTCPLPGERTAAGKTVGKKGSLPALDAALSQASNSGSVVQVSFSSGSGSGGKSKGQEEAPAVEPNRPANGAASNGCCYVIPSGWHRLALPECHLLCAVGPVGEDRGRLERALEDLAGPMQPGVAAGLSPANGDLNSPELSLSRLEERMAQAVTDCMEQVWQEVRPEEAAGLRETEEDIQRKTSATADIRAQVEKERQLQDQLLRAFHGQPHASSGVSQQYSSGAGGLGVSAAPHSGGYHLTN